MRECDKKSNKNMKKTVVELFAGVGGFRVGLNNVRFENGKVIEDDNFKFVWANQWEPSTKIQHAFDCYQMRFSNSKNHSNVDITLIDKNTIPDHTLLCGGFPCQDYSVARSLSKEEGIEGKKGVLWWQIRDILVAKKTPFILLENVDRLLKSPARQRGRDFGIMLRCLSDLNYIVEWRVINAAEYGNAQRRKRIYIFAYKKTTTFGKRISSLPIGDVFNKNGLFAVSFPVELVILKDEGYDIYSEYKDLVSFSNEFDYDFKNAGLLINNKIYTCTTKAIVKQAVTLKNIIESNVENHYFLNENEIHKFQYLRDKKKIERIRPDGNHYFYSEGSMSKFDSLDLPGRTMLTSEGSINRSTHIILDSEKEKLRILTPVECERLNGFPDNWTNSGMPEKRRYFMMGNALVCGIISNLQPKISKIISEEKKE